MIEIERHIVMLLLDNDCVIVPGFGGFMAHNLAASYDKKNNIYLPPRRTVGFNPRLTMNDSLLAQSYAYCYDISYPEALKRIEHEVDILKRLIEEDGCRTICGIGRIVHMPDGKYDFIPEESGIVTPALYGFEPFEINMLKQDDSSCKEDKTEDVEDNIEQVQPYLATTIFNSESNVKIAPADTQAVSSPSANKEIAVRIPVAVLRHLAAACIILFMLLSIPSKLGDASTPLLRQSSIDTSLLYEFMPKDMTSGKPDTLKVIKSKTVENTNAYGTPEGVGHEEDADCDKPQYSIVIASRIAPANAKAYVKKLHAKGLVEARVYTDNKMTMVVYKKFATIEAARKAAKDLKKNAIFTDSWVTKVK